MYVCVVNLIMPFNIFYHYIRYAKKLIESSLEQSAYNYIIQNTSVTNIFIILFLERVINRFSKYIQHILFSKMTINSLTENYGDKIFGGLDMSALDIDTAYLIITNLRGDNTYLYGKYKECLEVS